MCGQKVHRQPEMPKNDSIMTCFPSGIRIDQYIGLFLYPQYKKRPMYWSNHDQLQLEYSEITPCIYVSSVHAQLAGLDLLATGLTDN